ncbi:hypothetical protein QYF36_024698 [Acer negundo]|nr:hypothetical protein QYF36_024698 [Acer negundo]
MAKKRASKVKKKEEKLKQIDNIPNYTKQSRSRPPKRRADFSPFFSSNSGLSGSYACHEPSSYGWHRVISFDIERFSGIYIYKSSYHDGKGSSDNLRRHTIQ